MANREQMTFQKAIKEGDRYSSPSRDRQQKSTDVSRHREQYVSSDYQPDATLVELIRDAGKLRAHLESQDRSNRVGRHSASAFGQAELLLPLQHIETAPESMIEKISTPKRVEIRPALVEKKAEAHVKMRDERSDHRPAPDVAGMMTRKNRKDHVSSWRKLGKKISTDLLTLFKKRDTEFTGRPLSFQAVKVDGATFRMESRDPTTIDQITPASFSDASSQKLYNIVYRMFQKKQDASALVIDLRKPDPDNKDNTIIKLDRALAEKAGLAEKQGPAEKAGLAEKQGPAEKAGLAEKQGPAEKQESVEKEELKRTLVDYSLPTNDLKKIDALVNNRKFQGYTSVSDWQASFKK